VAEPPVGVRGLQPVQHRLVTDDSRWGGHLAIVQNCLPVSLPPAQTGGPATILPPRANLARYCLFGAAPLSFLTFLASSQTIKDPASRGGVIGMAVVSPIILVYTGLRVANDHAPAPVTPGREGVGRAGRWDWTDLLAYLPAVAAAYLVIGSLMVGITQAVDQALPATARTAVESFANQAGAYLAALAVLYVLVSLRRGLTLADLGWRLPRRFGRLSWWPWLLIAVVAAAAAYFIAEWLGSLSIQLLPNSPNTQCTTVRDQYGGYVAVAIPLVCVIAPLAEESIFRGFIYGWLRRHLTVLPALVIGAAIFSAAHLVLVLALPLFAVGIILGLLYEYSDSLLPGAIVHGLFNLVGIVAILGTTTTC
jgi:membrane protease YdiL (CAAX protease family)